MEHYNCVSKSPKKNCTHLASSGVASLLLPNGRTAHSRFRIPIDLDELSICDMKRGTNTTRNHLICDEFWRNFCNVFRDRHRFANGPFGLQFRPSFYDEPLITVMDWKLKSSQNKLPLFACDGRKKFSRRIGDKKNKELLTKKNNDKKLGKKERMEHSNHGLQDQAAAP